MPNGDEHNRWENPDEQGNDSNGFRVDASATAPPVNESSQECEYADQWRNEQTEQRQATNILDGTGRPENNSQDNHRDYDYIPRYPCYDIPRAFYFF